MRGTGERAGSCKCSKCHKENAKPCFITMETNKCWNDISVVEKLTWPKYRLRCNRCGHTYVSKARAAHSLYRMCGIAKPDANPSQPNTNE